MAKKAAVSKPPMAMPKGTNASKTPTGGGKPTKGGGGTRGSAGKGKGKGY